MSSIIENYCELPVGSAPKPIIFHHFPDTLHAVIWRNWDVIDAGTLAETLKGTREQIAEIALSMGLPPQRQIKKGELRRNYMTFLRRNWHLLPYEQICQILGWDAAKMQYSLNEDDCLWIKLGGYKPQTPPVYYSEPDSHTREQAGQVARLIKKNLGDALHASREPLFNFIETFNFEVPNYDLNSQSVPEAEGTFQLRMVYPYFLRYGEPLVGEGINDIPEGYLVELASCGVNAIWLQGVLNTLAPWDLAPDLSDGWQERLANLNLLVERAGKFGIKVLLYFNEPRGMPPSFFEEHPNLRGVAETPGRAPISPDIAALCISTPEVQEFLVQSVRHVFEHVPRLGGLFTITFSENLTNCYSRDYSEGIKDDFSIRVSVDETDNTTRNTLAPPCPRCEVRGPEATNAEICVLLERGMRQAGSKGKFLLYAWSTPEEWMPGIIEKLPDSTWLQCISEWGKTFTRGDYTGTINEYSISEIGPSEQSLRQWDLARKRGLKLSAKMQVANSYEVSSLPYIPALRLVAQHLANVTAAKVDSVMLGWATGGSPSPNLELVAEFVRSPQTSVADAMHAVAIKRFGAGAAEDVVRAWDLMSDAYREFPFDIWVCYNGPQSLGPANLLYPEPTGLVATMVGFPFDDLDGWRGPYSVNTFINQFQKLADQWQYGVDVLDTVRQTHPSQAIEKEWGIAEAARAHFRSTANQARFVVARDARDVATMTEILHDEIDLARRLLHLVASDSRIGYEASNHYTYIGFDLAEKILNCEQILGSLEESD